MRAEGGINKPSYYAFGLLHQLGDTRLANPSKNVIVTRTKGGDLAIAAWNLVDPDQHGSTKTVTLAFRGVPPTAGVTLQSVDDEHGNVLKAYAAMGKPVSPSPAQVEQLNRETKLPAPREAQLQDGKLTLTLEPNALFLLTVRANPTADIIASDCYTFAGPVCPMRVEVPVGSSCYCSNAYGALPGIAQAAASESLPSFDWPPPVPSARLLIPPLVFSHCNTLGDQAEKIAGALRLRGYAEITYWGVPNGVAIVTRLERIYPDGRSFAAGRRWAVNDKDVQMLSIRDYISRLFGVDEGFYRVVVFVITDQGFGSSDSQTTQAKTTRWLSKGFQKMPQSLAAVKLTSAYTCTALIYEFRKTHGQDPSLRLPSDLGAEQHMVASGLWSAMVGTPSVSPALEVRK